MKLAASSAKRRHLFCCRRPSSASRHRYFVRGGVGLHGAAAVRAVGAAGVVLDDQLLLLKESSVAAALQAPLRDFTGLETGLVSVGDKQWRVFDKPGFQHLRQIAPEDFWHVSR